MNEANPTTRAGTSHRLLVAVYSATFFVRFGFGLTLAVFASYIVGMTQNIGAGAVGLVGAIAALAPVGEFSTVLISGAAADRYGKFRILLIGMTAAAVLLAAISTTRTPWVLGGLNLLFGMASGAILASSLAIVADQAEEDHRGSAMGRFDAMNLLGWILGFAVGFGTLGVLANSSLYGIFLLGAGILATGLAVTWTLVRGSGGEPQTRPASIQLRRLVRTVARRDVLLVAMPWLVIYMLIGTGLFFLGTSSSAVGISRTLLAVVIGAGGLVLLATQPYFGRLSDRFGRIRMMLVGMVGFVALLTVAGLLSAFGPNPILLGLAGLSVLLALAYGPAALAALADLSESISRATTMAIYTLVIALGMVLGLLLSTGLFALLGNIGLYLFFAIIGVSLVTLTLVRYRDVVAGRAGKEFEPARPSTTPVR